MKPFVPKIIFSDFDGTLTEGHLFSSRFLDILEICESKQVPFVIVTGRSVQWAYFILTHFSWPCFFIAEGGGVLVHKKTVQDLRTEFLISHDEKKHLELVTDELLQTFSLELSADSSGRLTDRAIELSAFKDEKHKAQVEEFLSSQGIQFSSSNVHLNFWAGDISKSKSIKHFMKRHQGLVQPEETLFFGDSLNDQSVFKDFPHTVGVSNIKNVENQLKYRPTLTLKGKEAAGAKGVYSLLADWLK